MIIAALDGCGIDTAFVISPDFMSFPQGLMKFCMTKSDLPIVACHSPYQGMTCPSTGILELASGIRAGQWLVSLGQ